MADFNLKPGLIGQAKTEVSDNNTALKFGSGTVNVFATPAMVALMETAAINCVDRHLPDGYSSVGTRLDIRHLAATPVGMEVAAEAELVEVDGPRLKFKVSAYDSKEKIGEGTHNRYIVKLDEFITRAREKS
jgi:predicted thioesterase